MPKHIIRKNNKGYPKRKGQLRKSFTLWQLCYTKTPPGYGVFRKNKNTGQIHLEEKGLDQNTATRIMHELNDGLREPTKSN